MKLQQTHILIPRFNFFFFFYFFSWVNTKMFKGYYYSSQFLLYSLCSVRISESFISKREIVAYYWRFGLHAWTRILQLMQLFLYQRPLCSGQYVLISVTRQFLSSARYLNAKCDRLLVFVQLWRAKVRNKFEKVESWWHSRIVCIAYINS